jgi:hypothetical protein
VPASENSQTTEQAIWLAFDNLTVTPTATTMTIAYEQPGNAPLAVTLGGQTLTASINRSNPTQNQSVVFAGLEPCHSYSWSVPGSNGTISGQTNTLNAGNSPCSPTESILADKVWRFVGFEHQEERNFGCGGWQSPWPVGYGWRFSEGTTQSGEFGFIHRTYGSSWCSESTVQVSRFELFFDFTPVQVARGIDSATLTGTYSTEGTPPGLEKLCAPGIYQVDKVVWGQNSQGAEWATYTGGPETDDALVLSNNGWGRPFYAANGAFSVPYGQPGAGVVAGFAALNDGFGDLEGGAAPSFAADNNVCMTEINSATLTVTYAPMPPETPVSCKAADTCNGSTVTCNWSPDVFELFATDSKRSSVLVATVDARGGATPVFADPAGSPTTSYSACTINSAGATACAPVGLKSVVPCPVCQPATCASLNASCGSFSDGCGGTLQCGVCHAPCGDPAPQCGPGSYLDTTTCTCKRDFCACGGVYPKCSVCQ